MYEEKCATSIYSGNTGGASPKQPPLGRIFNAMEVLAEAATRSREVGSALVGEQPDGTSKGLNAVSNGLFDEMEQAADRIEAYAFSIIGDMQRILSRL